MKATVMTTGPGRDHRDRDRVEELALGEPVVLVDDAAVEERDDRQAAAEHERARLGEVERDLRQQGQRRRRRGRDRGAERGQHARRNQRGRGRPAQRRGRTSSTTTPEPRKSQMISDSVQPVADGADREQHPEQPSLPERQLHQLDGAAAR